MRDNLAFLAIFGIVIALGRMVFIAIQINDFIIEFGVAMAVIFGLAWLLTGRKVRR